MVSGAARGFGRSFWGLTVSNGLFFAGFHMLLPTVPLLATDMGGSSTEVGLIAGIFVFSSVIVRLFANVLIQALGFRACLLAGLAISFVSVLLYPLAGSVEMLLWIRLVHGAGFGIGTTFYVSLVMEFIPAARRGEGLGYFGLATTVAMAVAPASGLWVIEAFGFAPMFLLAATCEVLSLLALLTCSIPPSLNRPAAGTATEDTASERGSWTAVIVEKGTSRAALMTVLFGVAYGSVLNFVAVYAQEMQSSYAGLFFVIATTCIFMARLVTAKVYDLKGPAWVIAPGAIIMGTGLTVLALGSSTAMFLSAAILYGVGVGMLFPALQAETLSPVPPHRRSAASATFSNALDTGLGGGSVVLGLFANSAGLSAAYLVATACSVAVLVALFAGVRVVRELVPSVEEQ
jgi:MFS family permease